MRLPKLMTALLQGLAFALALGGSRPAAAQAPYLLVASQDNSSVYRFNGTTGAFIDVFVTSGSGGLSLTAGLRIGPDGNLYVCSDGSNQVLRYNGTTGAFMDVFASDSGLTNPFDLVFGPDGNLYVVFGQNDPNGVMRFDGATGAYIDTFVSSDSGGLFCPRGLTFGPDFNLYVTHACSNGEVLRYNGSTGAFMDTFVPAGTDSNPHVPLFGPDGNLYVTDYANGMVVRYNGTTGAFIDDFVSSGSGGLSMCVGQGFGPDGNLYVSSAGTGNVLCYNGSTGAFLNVFATASNLQPTWLIFGGGIVPSKLTLKPPKVAGSLKVQGMVTLNAQAPPIGAVVKLTNTNPAATVPSSVHVDAGQTSATFIITTTAVSSSVSGTVTATYAGSSKATKLTVRPISVQSVSLTPDPVTGGQNVSGTVKLEAPAAPGDITVTLSSSNPAVANPTQPTITIPQGQQTGSFTVTTSKVTTKTAVAIKATANGLSKSKTLTVNP